VIFTKEKLDLQMNEENVKLKLITPAIQQAGWDIQTQVDCEQYFTDGRIIIERNKSKRKKGKKADYILFFKPNLPIAIIEAKDDGHCIADGMQQALDYAEILDIPFVYSSNGKGFIEHDKTGMSTQIERELPITGFPSPKELWERYKQFKGVETLEKERITTFEYYRDRHKKPRYYQRIAINRTIEAILNGQNRILLVMATGTGKTFTASQIVYKLWKSGIKKRILFLTDRVALANQAIRKDFSHFGNSMTLIKHKVIDKAFEIYMALYQGLVDYDKPTDAFQEFSPDFFDLIIIDECHRGSVNEDSTWRAILEYFANATQIGLTATPKETESASNIEYFGDPVYIYSLRQGIEDGFLAPYKVIRIGLNVDLEDFRPTKDQLDDNGRLIEDRLYTSSDFDRNLVIRERTQEVAKRITEYLKSFDRYAKTIVFCVNTDHAARLRQELINCNPDIAVDNHRYVMRITGNDPDGKLELDNFTNVEETYPVIATTSELLTTGIDAKTCKLIVLDTVIHSPTKFKQIIGRGTRVDEENGKTFFTIMDFRRATDRFADPDFDGDPVQIKEVLPDESINLDDSENDPINGDEEVTEEFDYTEQQNPPEFTMEMPDDGTSAPYLVSGVDVSTLHIRRQYLDAEGNLIAESLWDYSKKGILNIFRNLDDFLTQWKEADRKQEIIRELQEQGILIEDLRAEIKKDLDIFDLICHIAWDQPTLTRRERAQNVKKRNYFTKYGEQARNVLIALLDKYAEVGIESIEDMPILKVDPFLEIVSHFGGKKKYLQALHELESELYKAE